ncbi:flippase [Thermococcus sp. 21S9]|nr:flippase [Thermococcus sp. 21S9]
MRLETNWGAEDMPDEVAGELGRAARGGAIALIGLIASAIFGFLTRAIVGRVYGPEQYGVYNLAFTVFTITLIVVMMGFPMGMQRQVSYFLSKKPEKVKELIGTALTLILITSTLGMVVLEVLRGALPKYIGGDGLLKELLEILAISLPISATLSVLISISQGFKRVREYTIYGKIIAPLLYTLLIALTGVILNMPIHYIVGAYVISQGITLTLVIRDLKVAGILPGKPYFSGRMARAIVLFSIPLMMSGIINLVMTWTDTLMLGHYLSSDIVGIYNAAAPLARFIPVFLSAMTVIYNPIVTRFYTEGRVQEISEFYSAITKWILLLTFPLFLLLFTYPKAVITALFGVKYVEAWKPLMVLSAGFLVHSIVGPNGLTLISIGKPSKEMTGNLLGAIINVVLNTTLIPLYGMMGASIATASAYVVANVYKLSVLRRYGISPFSASYTKTLILGTVITAVALTTSTSNIFIALGLTGVFTIGFYALCLITGTFEQRDIEIIRIASERFNLNLERVITLMEKLERK